MRFTNEEIIQLSNVEDMDNKFLVDASNIFSYNLNSQHDKDFAVANSCKVQLINKPQI